MKKIGYVCLLLFLTAVAQAQTLGNISSKIADMAISEEKGNKFLQAVRTRQTAVVKQMLVNVWPMTFLVDYKDASGNTPLMIAAEKGYFDLVQLLTQKGARVNTTNNENQTALCIAVKNKRVKTDGF